MKIYNENINDLLNPDNKNLDIREHFYKGIFIPGLTESGIKTHQEAMDLL